MEQCGVSFAVTLNEPSAELNALRAAGVEDEVVLPDLVRKSKRTEFARFYWSAWNKIDYKRQSKANLTALINKILFYKSIYFRKNK